MITKTSRSVSIGSPVTANTSITSGATKRTSRRVQNKSIVAMTDLTPAQQKFARQLQMNVRRKAAITGATNTTNIAARPEFLELLPMFVQDLVILDVLGSIAMTSRQQIVPYFKFIAENTKGETNAGTVLSSPFVNRNGVDPYYASRVVKNEDAGKANAASPLSYVPVLPGTVTITLTTQEGDVKNITDDGNGVLGNGGTINYATGAITIGSADGNLATTSVKATYQYDNENVGPRPQLDGDKTNGGFGHDYGAQMGKGYLMLDEFDLKATAHELACYWSVYSAFAAQQEYGANIADIAKQSAISEITAEINSEGFQALKLAAQTTPQFNWDASPVLAGSVVPHDYLNMFKLTLQRAANSVYQKTRLSRPNRLVVGSNVAAYISMIDGFNSAGVSESVGPYKLGDLDQFGIYVDPNYDPDEWVMNCKSDDIRRNSGIFGEYMPITNTDALTLANASAQQGYATMYGIKIVNPATVVSGRIVGAY